MLIDFVYILALSRRRLRLCLLSLKLCPISLIDEDRGGIVAITSNFCSPTENAAHPFFYPNQRTAKLPFDHLWPFVEPDYDLNSATLVFYLGTPKKK